MIFNLFKKQNELEEALKVLQKKMNSLIEYYQTPKFIGEVCYTNRHETFSKREWFCFTKQDLIDQVGNNVKIGIQDYFCPQWFNEKDIIIYDKINPFNKEIERIKKLKEQEKIK